jgi:predicted peroxiredoxin
VAWSGKKEKENMSMEEKQGVVIIATHGGEDPERATIPFVMGNASIAMDEKATIVLQGTGVFLAKKGYVEHVHAGGFDPLKKLMNDFLELGGQIFVCSPCINERNIAETDLIEKSKVIAGGTVINECCDAKAVLSY